MSAAPSGKSKTPEEAILAMYGGIRKFIGSGQYGFEAYYVVAIALFFFLYFVPTHFEIIKLASFFILIILPFFLPWMLWQMFKTGWIEYKQQELFWSTEHTLLEIRLPEEITQSPRAAELFFKVLYQTGEVDTPFDVWKGKTSPWFSLEIASTEGKVKFYIWTRTKFAGIIRAQLYAHYPTVQVVDAEDYTLKMPFDLNKMDVWGITQALQKPDPYPIMTYPAWGLDKADTKEEFKNDPLNSVIEFFGTMGPGEHAWMQIIVRAHAEINNNGLAPWAYEKTHEKMDITKWAQKEIDALGTKYVERKKDEEGNEIPSKPSFMTMPEGDREAVTAISNKLNKQIFDTGIRILYVTKKENKDPGKPAGFPTMMRSFEHGSQGRGLNGLKPMFYIGPFMYPWQDFMGMRKAGLKKRLYEGYVSRQIFYPPTQDYWIELNVEELATLWHLPGKVNATPNLERMPSRRSGAPSNLPI